MRHQGRVHCLMQADGGGTARARLRLSAAACVQPFTDFDVLAAALCDDAELKPHADLQSGASPYEDERLVNG